MLLLGHIRALRGHPYLRNAWIICFFESNLGLEAAHMVHMVSFFLLLHHLTSY
jgi:hypothetical protein